MQLDEIRSLRFRTTIENTFAADEALDAHRFVGVLSPRARFQIGSDPPIHGLGEIEANISELFRHLRGIRHRLRRAYELDETLIYEATVEYTFPDSRTLTLEYVNVLQFHDALIVDYRIYLDRSGIQARPAVSCSNMHVTHAATGDHPMPDDVEARLRRVEDELEIRNLAARFSDAANERDFDGFGTLWTDDGIWEIGDPLAARADGREAIVKMLRALLAPKVFFMQMTHSGVIEFIGPDTARARFVERERGRGSDDFYENLAVYHDDLRRTESGWRFARRRYVYRYLDTSPFDGDTFAAANPE